MLKLDELLDNFVMFKRQRFHCLFKFHLNEVSSILHHHAFEVVNVVHQACLYLFQLQTDLLLELHFKGLQVAF